MLIAHYSDKCTCAGCEAARRSGIMNADKNKEIIELAKLMRVYSGWDWGESDCVRIAEQMIKEGYRKQPSASRTPDRKEFSGYIKRDESLRFEENASGNECPCYTAGYSKCPIHGKENAEKKELNARELTILAAENMIKHPINGHLSVNIETFIKVICEKFSLPKNELDETPNDKAFMQGYAAGVKATPRKPSVEKIGQVINDQFCLAYKPKDIGWIKRSAQSIHDLINNAESEKTR